MLWSATQQYEPEPFENEADLEAAVLEVAPKLFGLDRIYLDAKKKIKRSSGRSNIPDGYLIDLTSRSRPRLFVVENETSGHHAIKHVASQILEFSIAFEDSPQLVKSIVKQSLSADEQALATCDRFARENGFENVDYLLERLICDEDAFFALVLIDEVSDELETALRRRFRFPVEIVSLRRFADGDGNRIYEFEPFHGEVAPPESAPTSSPRRAAALDPGQADTIVVPAKEDGFRDVFLGEDRWYKIRLNASMIPQIRHIAAYQTAPTSAITHVADVAEIKAWPNSNKYELVFESPARKIGPLKLVRGGRVKAPQAPRYTTLALLESAKSLEDAFGE